MHFGKQSGFADFKYFLFLKEEALIQSETHGENQLLRRLVTDVSYLPQHVSLVVGTLSSLERASREVHRSSVAQNFSSRVAATLFSKIAEGDVLLVALVILQISTG